MTELAPTPDRHLLTRTDLAALAIPADEVVLWLRDGWLRELGTIAVEAGEQPVFGVSDADLAQDLRARLAALGKTDVTLDPARARAALVQSTMNARGWVAPVEAAVETTIEPTANDDAATSERAKDGPVHVIAAEPHPTEQRDLELGEAEFEALAQVYESAPPDDAKPHEDFGSDLIDAEALLAALDGPMPDTTEPAGSSNDAAEGGAAADDAPKNETPENDTPEGDTPEHSPANADSAATGAAELGSATRDETEVEADEAASHDGAPVEAISAATPDHEVEHPNESENPQEESLPEVAMPDEAVVEPLQSAEAQTETDQVAETAAEDTPTEVEQADDGVLDADTTENSTGDGGPVEADHVEDDSVEDGANEPSSIETDSNGPGSNGAGSTETGTIEADPTAPGPVDVDSSSNTPAAADATAAPPLEEQGALGNETAITPATDDANDAESTTDAATGSADPGMVVETPATGAADAAEAMSAFEPAIQEAEAETAAAAVAEAATDVSAASASPEPGPTPEESIPAPPFDPAASSAPEAGATLATMERVEGFLGELRGALVELAQRPSETDKQAVDIEPLVAAVGEFGQRVEHGVAVGVHAAMMSRDDARPANRPAPVQFVRPTSNGRELVMLSVAFLVLCWSGILWFKTGNATVAIGTLVGANVIACCLLARRRD